ncbi:MAG: response regulator transcription factor [Flavobacteriales bacterium]|nr:response regulator transcription factor [Flavobacteriales bacterium]MBK9074886.1 response regulator transcription factor [Flavobacteriales bacterium]
MGKPAKLRIAVVDDHRPLRAGLCTIIARWPHGEVVLEADDGIAYEAACVGIPPIDIAIVDLCMPGRDGFETIAWIRVNHPDTKCVAITFDPTDEAVHAALLAGACAVLSKRIEDEEIHTALDHIKLTGRYHNVLMERQLTHVPDPGSPLALRKKAKESFAPRELEFFLHYIDEEEHTRRHIADLMGITEHTAETYRKNVAEKTGAPRRLGMLRFALRFGLAKL